MADNRLGFDDNRFYNYEVPDLMVGRADAQNELDYFADPNQASLTSQSSAPGQGEQAFEGWQSQPPAKGINELVEQIERLDSYRAPDSPEANDVFNNFLVTLTQLKKFLLPNKEGAFADKWFVAAVEFQRLCEQVFLNHIKEEYVRSFLPLLPSQLEYTAARLKAVETMDPRELDDFKNLFSLIALGFVGKLKLMTFYMSLAAARPGFAEYPPLAAPDYQGQPSCPATCYQPYDTQRSQATVPCEPYYRYAGDFGQADAYYGYPQFPYV